MNNFIIWGCFIALGIRCKSYGLLIITPRLAQAIEVLCKNQAFFVKRAAPEAVGCPVLGQVTWSKHGGPKPAWCEALKRAGVPTAKSTKK